MTTAQRSAVQRSDFIVVGFGPGASAPSLMQPLWGHIIVVSMLVGQGLLLELAFPFSSKRQHVPGGR